MELNLQRSWQEPCPLFNVSVYFCTFETSERKDRYKVSFMSQPLVYQLRKACKFERVRN